MAAGTVKLITYNTLAEGDTWDVDAGGLVKPPAMSITGSDPVYTNIAGANFDDLIKDGDQNIPVFFTAGVGNTKYVMLQFGVAFAPSLIAIINHNCFESGDSIVILSGPPGGPYVARATIAAPNRSVDIFYPLRFNDCWYNSGAISDIIWRVAFNKAAGKAYVGDIFFASQYFSYQEWDPQPSPPLSFDFQRNAAINEIVSGSEVVYDIIPPFVNIGLDWGRKAEGPVDSFLEHQIDTVLTAASHSPYKQVLVLRDDRVCVFGRLEPNGGYQELSDDSISPAYRFRAEYPRKFYRSALVA